MHVYTVDIISCYLHSHQSHHVNLRESTVHEILKYVRGKFREKFAAQFISNVPSIKWGLNGPRVPVGINSIMVQRGQFLTTILSYDSALWTFHVLNISFGR